MRGGRNQRPVIFLDVPASHVDALSIGVAKKTEAWGSDRVFEAAFANELSNGNGSRVSAIGATDFKGRASFFESVTGRLEAKAHELLGRLGLVEPRATWAAAHVEVLDVSRTQELLKNAAWDTQRDGLPTAVELSFGGSG